MDSGCRVEVNQLHTFLYMKMRSVFIAARTIYERPGVRIVQPSLSPETYTNEFTLVEKVTKNVLIKTRKGKKMFQTQQQPSTI